jgi:hypothetical protein
VSAEAGAVLAFVAGHGVTLARSKR